MMNSGNKAAVKVPVLILDGEENTLSLTRSFGKRNIDVSISAPGACFALKSRYCKRKLIIPDGIQKKEYWHNLLLVRTDHGLDGSVIFAASDEAVEFLAANRESLIERYVLDDAVPHISNAMLNKLDTLDLARKAGCPTPAFHRISSLRDVEKIADSLMLPIMIKPLHSHLFTPLYKNMKYLVANSRAELFGRVNELLAHNLEFMITEIIPGPDHLQSAYFTYMNGEGKELFNYTHQIVRRYPKNSGSACLTISKDLPQTREMGRRFFQGIGFRGMGHVEFKLDTRDGQLKIIECNPRTSAAQAIVTKSGLDMAYHIYNYLLTGVLPEHSRYRSGVRRWWVLPDVRSFFELNRQGELHFPGWVKSVKGPPLVFPYFSLKDPVPFFYKTRTHFSYFVTKRVGSLWSSKKESAISG